MMVIRAKMAGCVTVKSVVECGIGELALKHCPLGLHSLNIIPFSSAVKLDASMGVKASQKLETGNNSY